MKQSFYISFAKMKVKNGVETFALTMNFMGSEAQIYPTIIWDNDNLILVDTGNPRQLEGIRLALEKAGVPFARLNKIIITHQDNDHIGSLPEILKASERKIEVLAHEADKEYIEGGKPWLKLEMIRKMLQSVPAEQRQAEEALYNIPVQAGVDRTVSDGEVLPDCGGITVIHTPGHTPGHICLYLNQSKTLIAGDALNIIDGRLAGPIRPFATDSNLADKSLDKLTQYDIETVICYHGGVYQDNVRQRLSEIAGEREEKRRQRQTDRD
ncbi:MAG TPA: MBL fold metallo-hydrolase [Desulfitobacteriaceae bacterium]|nr:MBL fold metallo-hydrolase [Desulfitobacteriaceae bacterium]